MNYTNIFNFSCNNFFYTSKTPAIPTEKPKSFINSTTPLLEFYTSTTTTLYSASTTLKPTKHSELQQLFKQFLQLKTKFFNNFNKIPLSTTPETYQLQQLLHLNKSSNIKILKHKQF
uniref:Ovule protein n=1 Tax=Panagrolaimus sp. ES5 TaxID=591445 RepID=A0AC34GY54_9BILA